MTRKKTYRDFALQKEARRAHEKYLKEENDKKDFRCRSAYKLLEIQDTYKIFKRGQTVVDLGCAPGSWTQVAVKSTAADSFKTKSLVLGIDLQQVLDIEGATLLSNMDFTEQDSQEQLKRILGLRKVDVLLSDMAANTTGMRFVDHINVSNLCNSVLRFAQEVCDVGATLVMKVFDGGECKQLMKDTRFLFEKVRVVHPKATRQPSSEMFYVGFRYKGTKLLEEPDLS